MRCLLESNKFWLALIVLITNFAYGSPELNIEQVAEIVCDSRVASINFKCHLEYGKIDVETTTQINKYKRVCSKVMKMSRKKCKNSAIENCNLATDNMKKYCESKFKEIRNSRLVARNVIEKSCQRAFNVTKRSCITEYMKLVKPKISKIDKFLKIVTIKPSKPLKKTTKLPKLTTIKPIISKENEEDISSVIDSIFNENKSNISTSDMEIIFNQILSESENYPIKPKLPAGNKPTGTIKPKIKPKNIESMINSIFNENKHKLTKEDMAQFINHVLIGDIHSKTKTTIRPRPIRQNKSKSKTLKISTAAKSLIDFIFGKSQSKINTDNLLGFIDEVFADAEFDPTKPVKVRDKKPIVIPNSQAIIKFIFGKNPTKIHRHLMISFIERILDPKYEYLRPTKLAPKQKPKIVQLNKSKGVPLISKPKHKTRERIRPQKQPISSIKISLDIQKAIDFLFGEEQNKMNKVELVNFINFIFSSVDVNQLKPNIKQKHTKVPSVQSVIKFIFGKNPTKIHKQMLADVIQRIMDIQKMPKKLIREKLLSLQLGKSTGKPKIKIVKPSASIQSIIDFIFGEKQKSIETNILVKFIKEMFENFHFTPTKPVKQSDKPHLEMPENEAMINFIFGESQKLIKKPVLLAFIDKIINSNQYHSEVVSLIKPNRVQKFKPTKKPISISKAKIIKLPKVDSSFSPVIDFIFGESQYKIEKQELIWFLKNVFSQKADPLKQKQPIKKPKSASKPADKMDFNNILSFIFGEYLEKLSKSDINYCVNKFIKVAKVPKSLMSVDNIFTNLKTKIEKYTSLLFNDKSYANKLYMPLIVDYLLGNYLDKIKKSPGGLDLSKLKSKPNFLKTLTKVLSEPKSKRYTIPKRNNKPAYGVNILKPKPADKEKQEPFDVSFAFNIISQLLGDKNIPEKSVYPEELNKGNKNIDNKVDKINHSPLLPISKIKSKLDIQKENAIKSKIILATIYKTVNELFVKDSLHLSKSIKDKNRINKILSSFPINPEKLKNVSEDDKELIVSLIFEVTEKIVDMLSKYSKSHIKTPSSVKGEPFDSSFAFEIIDDLLDSNKNHSADDKIISIYDSHGNHKNDGSGKTKHKPEKGEIQLEPPGNSKIQKGPDGKPEKDGELKKPSKSNSVTTETPKEAGLNKLKTTVKIKDVSGKSKKTTSKSIKTTAKPKKSSDKSKKTTAKPKISKTTSKTKKTTSKGKITTAKSKKTTVKGKKTTVKSKTTAKPKKTTAKGKKTTAKAKVTTAKSKKTTVKAKKTTVKPKKG